MISKLLMIKFVGSNKRGFSGALARVLTEVTWKALLSITIPTSDSTEISPTTHNPLVVQLGSRITIVLPVSSTVMVKSVPLTPITAVGVFIMTFCLEFFAICPDA